MSPLHLYNVSSHVARPCLYNIPLDKPNPDSGEDLWGFYFTCWATLGSSTHLEGVRQRPYICLQYTTSPIDATKSHTGPLILFNILAFH